MNENAAAYRTGRVQLTRIGLSASETRELRLLFDQLGDSCGSAGDALGKAGPPPIGPDFQRFKELSMRVSVFADRIKQVMG